jgi:hypothetical protein
MRAFLLVALLYPLLPALALADPAEAALMAQAQRAYLSGDLLTSAHLFQQVLVTDPQNTLAIQFLHKIILAAPGAMPQPAQGPIKDLVLPKVEFKDAAFSAALDFLKQEAARQSVSVSFVTQLPDSQLTHQVSLNLNQIPFLEALRYLCEANSATYKIDPYAIVITPASAADAAPTP